MRWNFFRMTNQASNHDSEGLLKGDSVVCIADPKVSLIHKGGSYARSEYSTAASTNNAQNEMIVICLVLTFRR